MGRQVRIFGPISRFPRSHLYSMTEPTSKLVANIVEFGGRSGLPQILGPIKR